VTYPLACMPHTPAGLMEAVLDVNPMKPEYLRHDADGNGTMETFCNIYLRALLARLGLAIPAMLANALFHWFDSYAARDLGWLNCSLEKGMEYAGRGEIVVGALFEEGHGHVVMMVDGQGNITQAGRTNHVKAPLSRCFTPEQLKRVRWFHHL